MNHSITVSVPGPQEKQKENSSKSITNKDQKNVRKVASSYANGEVTEAQYLAEKVCERLAKKNGTEIGIRFWQEEVWKKVFKDSVYASNTLLKKYPFEAILEAWKKNPRSYSLRGSFFLLAVDKESKLLTKKKEVEQNRPDVVIEDDHPIFKAPERKSKLSKLD